MDIITQSYYKCKFFLTNKRGKVDICVIHDTLPQHLTGIVLPAAQKRFIVYVLQRPRLILHAHLGQYNGGITLTHQVVAIFQAIIAEINVIEVLVLNHDTSLMIHYIEGVVKADFNSIVNHCCMDWD